MRAVNKKASFAYILDPERVEAGLQLTGGEARAVREGHVDLSRSLVRILNGEAFLINANIPVAGAKNYNSTRSRKLLLHREEIISISTKIKQRKLTIVPTRVYNKGRLIKLEFALGKPKRKFEKKEAIKKKDISRDIEAQLKDRLR